MSDQHPDKRLVRLSVAAEYADVHVDTIRRRIADGRLTGYRMGVKLLRVDLNEVDALFHEIPTTSGDGRGVA
jgi:excisionase family DNA binding protein